MWLGKIAHETLTLMIYCVYTCLHNCATVAFFFVKLMNVLEMICSVFVEVSVV